jgi:hypothetical protein
LAAAVKEVRFLFDNLALPDVIVLCLGNVEVGDRLFNTLPTEADSEPSFTVEKIAGQMMTVSTADKRRGKLQFHCLSQEQWEARFG